ncbi:MAG: ATP-binding protein [Bdellovibrionia bacterium]
MLPGSEPYPKHPRGLRERLGVRLFQILSVILLSGTYGWFKTREKIQQREASTRFIKDIMTAQLLIQRFTIETDLALIALATSDWQVLIERRLESQRVSQKLQKQLLNLRMKANNPCGLEQIEQEWEALYRAATLALRYEQGELRGNPQLHEVDKASKKVTRYVEEWIALLQIESERQLSELNNVQLFTLGLNFTVIVSAMIYSLRQFISPLTQALINLETTRTTLLNQQTALIQSAKLATLGEMASGIAHEINNPLCAIKGQAEMMELLASKEKLTIQRSLSTFHAIIRTVDRIADVVKGLRNISRLESNMPFNEVPVQLVIDDALSVCRQRFLQAGIEIRVCPIPSTLMLECHAGLISQALLHLLSNAYDAVEGLSEKWIKMDVRDLRQEIEISVTDSGPGIPSETAKRIMEPFFTGKEVGKGTGIGLNISQTIVRDHHGNLELDVTSSNTRFVLSLPKKRPLSKPLLQLQ